MNVLYVNQTSQMSGAERSLLTLLEEVRGAVSPTVACPPGRLAREVEALGIPTVPIRSTDVSFRLHPVHTPRGLGELAAAAREVARVARDAGTDVVHANTTRAGLVAIGASRLGAPRPVVHVRDWVPEGRAAQATLAVVRRGAAEVVANSHWAAAQFGAGARTGARVTVLHNPIDAVRFDPERIPREAARAALDLVPGQIAVGVVGQLTPWKGQRDAVEALALIAEQNPRIQLVLAGSAKFAAASTRFDNRAYESELRARIDALGLYRRVLLLGEREDVPQVMRALDVLLVPSWREAFGRVAAEAMAMQVPVIATNVGGPAEIVADGVTGSLLPPRDPARWAREIVALAEAPTRRTAYGRAGRRLVLERFDSRAHVAALLDVYRRAVRTPGRAQQQGSPCG